MKSRVSMINWMLRALAFTLWVSLTPATANAQSYQGGAVSQYWYYPEGAWNVDQWVSVREENPNIFYANQWWFSNGNSGYMGLQQLDNGHRIAIFSIFGGIFSEGSNCSYFDHEGWGQSCKIDFAWESDRWYKLRLWRLFDEPGHPIQGGGGTRWGAWVIDDQGGATMIGSIRTNGHAPHTTGGVSFVEYFGPAAQCGELPGAMANFNLPRLNNDRVRATHGEELINDCAGRNRRIVPFTHGSYIRIGS